MKIFKLSLLLVFILTPYINFSQNKEVTIVTTKLSDNVFMLVGQGGNIGVSVGEDGIFIIDDQFARLTPKILDAIRKISDQPVKFLVNTHWHGDHTGGNVNMTKEGATILAHDNVRKRLEETPKRDGSKRLKEALPVITFNDKMNIHINGEKVKVFHMAHAHTDGDALLYFSKSNVLHTGDTYFNSRYPYIDLNSGGSIDGYINVFKNVLEIIDDETKIIPGHGAVSNKQEYADYLVMLSEIRSLVKNEVDKGKSEDEVANNTNLLKKYDDLGFGNYFISSERIKRIIYKSLKN